MNLKSTLYRKMNTAKILLHKGILYLMKLFYFPGHNYNCPCCDSSLRRFMNYEYKSITSMNPELFRKNYRRIQCPYCNSLPRHRIMAYFLKKHPHLIQNKKLVIFGMLQGEKTFFTKHGIPYIFADLYDPSAQKEDLSDLSFANHSVDILICHHILEHVEDVPKALSEIRRVLSPDGFAVLSVPMDLSRENTYCKKRINTPQLRKKYYGQTDHLRLFGKDFSEILEQSGFKVYTLDGDKFPQHICPITGPASTDINRLYLCRVLK